MNIFSKKLNTFLERLKTIRYKLQNIKGFIMTSEERDENEVALATRFTFRPSEVLSKDLIPRSTLYRGSFIIASKSITPPNGVSGFTLVETLVAVSILLISIVGPLTVASRSLLSARYAKDQITAFYLTQEATELIRNKRDDNAISGSSSWMDGLGSCFAQSGCKVDATDGIFSSCSAGVCQPLRKFKSTGFYGYNSGWEETKFTRTINLTNVNSNEIKISINIAWNTGILDNNFTIVENLLDWQ